MSIRGKMRSVRSTIAGGMTAGSGGLHGSDILDGLKATAGRRKKIFKDKTFVPDHYTVYLAKRDLAGLKTFLKALKAELLEEMHTYLSKQKFQLNSSGIQLSIKPRHTLQPGQMAIIGRFVENGQTSEKPQKNTIRLKLLPESSREEVRELAEGASIIGRGRDTHITVPAGDMLVSKHHCRVDVRPDGIWLRDLGSSNGTFLNQREIRTKEELNSGDRIRIGQTDIEVLV